MTWVSGRLEGDHELDEFDCGVESLNQWLVNNARRADKQDTARVYVWTRREQCRVMAYFAINPTRVDRLEDGISKSAAKLDRAPAYLISRLAVDRSIQGQGVGKDLVLDAVGRIVEVAQLGGGRLIVVDAVDEPTAGFYRKLDFIPVHNTPNRLYMKVETARASLGIGQFGRPESQ